MYLRFITQFVDEDGKDKTGLFQAMAFIRDHSLTKDEDEYKLQELTNWFNKNLDAPTFFSDTKPGWQEKAVSKSLSWFKDSAKEHILKVHELIVILEKYDLIVEIVTSKNIPGQIVFSDEFQISAIPFRSNTKRVV